VDGKPLKEVIEELIKTNQSQTEKITKLEKENKELKKEKVNKEKMIEILKEVFGEENFQKDKEGKEKYIGKASGSGTNTSTDSTSPNKPVDPSNTTEAQKEEQK